VTIGQNFLIKIAEKQAAKLLASLEAEDFQEEFERPVYAFMLNYYLKHETLPPIELIRKKFSLDEPISGELTFWYDEFLKRKFLIHYDQHLNKINKVVAEGNIEKAKRDLQEMTIDMSHIGYEESPVMPRQQLVQDTINALDERRAVNGVIGIPSFWAGLDRMLHGFIGGNLYAIAGRKKIGKTQVLILCAEAAYDLQIPLFVLSMEMTQSEYANRVVALSAQMGQNYITTGRVSTPMQHILQLSLVRDKSIYSFREGFFNVNTAEIEHLIIMEKPKLFFIDGAYLVRGTNISPKMAGWERVTETIKELKIIAGKHKIPIVCTYQFNKEGDIHLSDSIAQIATAVVGVYEPNNRPNTRLLRVIDNRNGTRGDVLISWDFNTMDFRELETDEESQQGAFLGEDLNYGEEN